MLSFWQQDAFFRPADIVIAGGGFMGLWSAYELKQQYPELTITVLEKDVLPGGASVRNAGFACFGSPGELLADATSMSEAAMWNLVAMRYKGIQKVRAVLGDAAIDYDPCGGYECFNDSTRYQQVADKLPWLNRGMENITGIADVFLPADNSIAALGLKNFNHMIANRLEGGLHSGKAMQALLQKLYAMDIMVLNGACVESWKSADNHLLIEVSGAYKINIKTNKFLITNNAFASQLTNVPAVQPARGQILITKPVIGLPLRGAFHYDDGFYYWRNAGNRILLGGARNQAFQEENTIKLQTTGTIQSALKNFLYQHIHLPDHQLTIDYSWAGIMGFTYNKQPIIHKIQPHVWTAIACNGMGVALTPVMAEQVVTQMMG